MKVQKFIAFLSHDRAIKRDIQRNSTTRKSQKSLIKQGKIELRRDVKIKNYTIRNQQVAGSSPASSSSVGDPSARLRKSSRSKSGCFFFGCAPGLLLLPMQPAPLGLHGVPFCPGFICITVRRYSQRVAEEERVGAGCCPQMPGRAACRTATGSACPGEAGKSHCQVL